jgi:uncharacterized protein (DUF2235 family)
MSRNLVICCDGTNNSLAGVKTNVARLSDLADLGDESLQLRYYDAGVGVEADPRVRTRIGATLSRWSGSAFGTGLVANVEQAYRHLVQHYATGDRIFMFGFSRGAYTVRVIAGLLQNYGLLRPQYERLATDVVEAFRDLFSGGTPAERQRRFDAARAIRVEQSLPGEIHFMGLFDTVSSLGWAWDPKTFPNTFQMPNVSVLRHALALDERRAKFRTNRVQLDVHRDHRQMWFAGVHSDVGGGYEPPNDRLSRVPLRWMLAAAKDAGMRVNPDVEGALALEQSHLQDEQAPQNESLAAMWRALEYLPLPHRERAATHEWIESRRVYRCQGWREIRDTFEAHDSLQRRKIEVKNVHWKSEQSRIRFSA